MTPPPDERFPLAPARATCYLWCEEHRGATRFYLRFSVPDSTDFALLRSSFRAHFPRHGDASYSKMRRCWSLPLGMIDRLSTFLRLHVTEDAVRSEQPADLRAGAARRTSVSYGEKRPSRVLPA